MARLRRNRRSDRPLVAAAARIPLTDAKAARKLVPRKVDWQTEAWGFYDEVPEVKFTTRWAGDLCAKVVLFIAADNPDDPDGVPIPADNVAGLNASLVEAAKAELGRLFQGDGGMAAIVREHTLNMDVAGECWLYGRGERAVEVAGAPDVTAVDQIAPIPVSQVLEPERWEIKSIDEVEATQDGKTWKVKDSRSGDKVLVDPENDTLIRLWCQHPQHSWKADSYVRSVLADCRVIQALTEQLLADANSRRNAGILFVDNEIAFERPKPTTTGGTTGDEQDEHTFLGDLADALIAPIEDASAPSSVVPLVARAPKDSIDKGVKHISFARASDGTIDDRIEKRVNRIARGLNAPVEVVTGHKETTFANADVIDEDKITDHVEPRVLLLCDNLTSQHLHARLRLPPHNFSNDEVQQVYVWADASPLLTPPDPAKSVEFALGNDLISDEAARKVLGYSEDDAPSIDEVLMRLTKRKAILTADLAASLMKAVGFKFETPVTLDPQNPVNPAPAPAPPAQAAFEQAAMIAALLGPVMAEHLAGLVQGQGRAGTRLLGLPRDVSSRPG